jgi:hypothetical protein
MTPELEDQIIGVLVRHLDTSATGDARRRIL